MTRRALLAVALVLTAGAAPPIRRVEPVRPKLVLGIVIDQFRYDYLTRFRGDYTGGLHRLLANGAVFTNARYQHMPTVTAVGHSIFMTGAMPSVSGIVGNEWFDRAAGRTVTSVSDPETRLLGGERDGPGCSPRRLMVSTVGDELKRADRRARVIGISIKDRSAILPAGHMADGAYWFDTGSGNFVSSTFYFTALPDWMKRFNAERPADSYRGAQWLSKRLPAEPGPKLYGALEAGPWGNELLERLAERAIDAEQLGQRGVTDLLTVSFSSNDYVGHEAGPDSPEVRDMAVRVDRSLGKLFEYVERRVGMANVLVVLTADHGVAPMPEVLAQQRMPGGRVTDIPWQAGLVKRYGAGEWVVSRAGGTPYLNRALIRERKLDEGQVERTEAEDLAALPHVLRVYTRHDLETGRVPDDPLGRAAINGFCPNRSGDVVVIAEPYWMAAPRGTTHGSPYGYDTHVPVMFLGPGIRAGRYDVNIAPNDIAPTLATMLEIETPSGSRGRVLTEMRSR